MFEKLVDFLLGVIELFYVTRVVSDWEQGVVLRFGRYKRDASPGLRWVWPLGIERLVTTVNFPRPARLPPQSLTTSDGVAVVVSAVVTHKVQNARKVLLECGDAEEALLDSLTGVIASHVTGATWSDLTGAEFWDTVTSDACKKAKSWGVKVLSVQPADVARCRSLRLFGLPAAALK